MKSRLRKLVYSILLYVYRFVGVLVRLVQPKQETKTTNKLPLELSYEPKRKFRWVLKIEGLDTFVVKCTTRPSFYKKSSKKYEPFYFQVVFYDPIKPSCSHKIMEWLNNPSSRQATLEILSPIGENVETWRYYGLSLQDIQFGELNYSKSEPVEITCGLTYDKVELL